MVEETSYVAALGVELRLDRKARGPLAAVAERDQPAAVERSWLAVALEGGHVLEQRGDRDAEVERSAEPDRPEHRAGGPLRRAASGTAKGAVQLCEDEANLERSIGWVDDPRRGADGHHRHGRARSRDQSIDARAPRRLRVGRFQIGVEHLQLVLELVVIRIETTRREAPAVLVRTLLAGEVRVSAAVAHHEIEHGTAAVRASLAALEVDRAERPVSILQGGTFAPAARDARASPGALLRAVEEMPSKG